MVGRIRDLRWARCGLVVAGLVWSGPGCSGETSVVAGTTGSSATGSGGAATVSSSATAGGSVTASGGSGGSAGSGGSGGSMKPAEVGAVYGSETFQVKETKDVVFAQGLTHSTWGSNDGKPMDLLLDVYQPVRDNPPPMPVVVVIHGGGFVGGTKSHGPLSDMARAFAARGWVAFSISYRLAKHMGTLPMSYPNTPQGISANQWRALYPACRDAKAAIRWIRANADEYSLSKEHVAAIGGSAGSFLAMALGVSDETDCVSEVSAQQDATLAKTHLEQSSQVQTIIDHWGGVAILNMLQMIGGMSRFDATDAPVSIVHGTNDPTVPFTQAETIRDAYKSTGVPYAFYPLDGLGHGPWGAKVENKPLTRLAFDFIVEQQKLVVE